MLSTRRPGRDVLGGRLLPPERRGARTSVVVPVLPPDRLYPYPLPFDEGNCHDVCEHRLLVTSYQVPMRLIGLAVVLALGLTLTSLCAQTQPVHRIGYLDGALFVPIRRVSRRLGRVCASWATLRDKTSPLSGDSQRAT